MEEAVKHSVEWLIGLMGSAANPHPSRPRVFLPPPFFSLVYEQGQRLRGPSHRHQATIVPGRRQQEPIWRESGEGPHALLGDLGANEGAFSMRSVLLAFPRDGGC
jgi:hypothetical protein